MSVLPDHSSKSSSDSPFSPTSFSPTSTSGFPWGTDQQLTQSIDDIIYRYSAEQDRGTPTVGIYAQDGLWDDDELSSEATTLRRGSGSTFGHSSAKNAKGENSRSNRTSVKARSRSGTMGSAIIKEDRSMWSWNKKPAGINSPIEQSPEVRGDFGQAIVPVPTPPPPKTLEKKKSKSLLRGKGRRGELSVNVSPTGPPPLPPTPASYLTNTPGLSTASTLSPVSHMNSSIAGNDFSPALTPNSANDKLSKSSWRRGMQKIFKSKSSMALREAFSSIDPNQPPVPNLPRPQNKLGKPFFSSTPPAATLPKRDTIWSIYDSPLSPPPVLGEPFRLSSHPSLPADPFASPLNSSSNNLPLSIPCSPLVSAKPRLGRNSPSLRDLKQFLAPKPKLTKAKSLANIRERALVVPVSAPPIKTQFTPIEPATGKLPKRVASVILPRSRRSIGEEPVRPPVLARPILSRIPTESPPLLPPNPPYFPTLSTLSSRSASSPSTPSTLSIDTSCKAPSSPLPALPSSAPLSPVGSTPIKRSGSGAVLLPRSRSTSMSLKAPPTSSSFFDLYEQLGIWPTPSDKETQAKKAPVATPEKLESFDEVENIPPEKTISESPSARFSADSWEAAISAFPLIDDIPLPPAKELDFGVPHMSDVEHVGSWSPNMDLGREYIDADASFTSNAAVGGSTCSTSHYSTSNRTSQTVQPAASSSSKPNTSRLTYSSGFRRISRGRGSNSSSGPPSRDERRKHNDGAWFHGASGESSGSSSEEEDDRPLSQLHPDAAAVQQQEAIKRRASRKAAKFRAKGRNPGGNVAWDGEGGIPAEVLTQRLESVMLNKQERLYNWQVAQLAATSNRQRAPVVVPATSNLRPLRSSTAPTNINIDSALSSGSMNRSQTVKRDGRSPLPPIPSPVEARFHTSPVMAQSGTFTDRQGSLRRPDILPPSMLSSGRSTASTRPASSSSSSQQYTQPSSSQRPLVPNVTRSNTAATSRSTSSRTRSRAASNAASTVKPEEKLHARSTTEPLPQRTQLAGRANAFVGSLNGTRIALDLYPETTARDALAASHSRGELPELALGLNWVVTEVFAEMGFERPVREYECLQTIVKGWDPVNRFNCFVFKQSNNAPSTWTRGIPTNAPFLGAYVQYESKKGKWSKRFLETRGGQVFLSKNDKNKEEVQINTLLHDVYTTTRSFNSPKPFVFVMKRVEAASTFEDPRDLMHIFCAEESIAWKLIAAVYDAKSHAIAQAQPQLLLGAQIQRRPTAKKDGPAPLIDLKEAREKPVEKTGFTGKGLLRM